MESSQLSKYHIDKELNTNGNIYADKEFTYGLHLLAS